MKKRRFLSILLSLALAVGLMPAMSLTAYAADPAIINDNTKTWSGDSTINQQVEINGEVTVSADMTLTIPETYTLKVNGGINAKGKTLTVTGPGTLDVFGLNTNSMQGVGIQGNIIVNGATVLVEAEQRRGIWGNVTVNGGEITVKGGTGVDNSSSPGSGSTGGEAIWGNVTVKGGKITAEGGTGGPGTTGKAGTGGKGVYGTVTVDGGKITVIGGNGGNSQSGSGGNGGYGISGSLIVNGGEAEVTGGIGGTGGSSGKNEAAVSSTISGTGAQESDDGNTWSAISEDRSTKRYVKLQGSTAVTGVKLDPSTAQTVSVGDKVSFTASIEPNDATNKKVKWSVGGDNPGAVTLYSDETCETPVGTEDTETMTVYAKGVSAGSAAVTVTSSADNAKTASCAVTVSKPDSVVTKAPAANTLTYTGAAQALVTAGEAMGGTMQYTLGKDATTEPAESEYKASVPTGTDAGTYYVWYKVVGDDSHNSTKPASVTVTINPVDKSKLNTAIKSAETYYDSIKDDALLTDIAATLKSAIDAAKATAGNDNAPQSDVDTQISTVGAAVDTAKKGAEAVSKGEADKTAAKTVTDAINALPATAGVKDKDAVASARAAYDALTEDQKKLVSAETLKKLTTAEQQVKEAEESTGPDAGQDPAVKAATDLIDALPATAELKDKDAVAAARAAYDALTEDQKKLVSAEALAKLTAAEQQVKEAEDAVKPVKISDCKIVVNNIVYTGSEINKPFVAVKYDDTRLKAGTDYDISCNKKIKAIGTYKVTVKGKGRYTGKVNLSFKVIPMGTTFSRVKGGDKRISLKWKKAEKVSGYIIQYSLKKDFSNKTMLKIKNASTLTKTVKKLKNGKRYYVRIRTYFTDKKKNTYYSKWSEIETVSVKAPSKKTNGEVFAINAGETLDLKVLLDVSDAEMRWVSSDEAVATVSEEGIVNALAPGDVVITAIDPDGEHVEISLRINGENELELDDVDLLEIDEVIGEEIEMDEAFELTIA